MSEAVAQPGNMSGRVLKAERVNEELGIAQRRAEAGQMLDKARQSAAQMLAAAREQGLEEGRKAVLTATVEDVRRILNEFSNQVRHHDDAFVDIVMQSVEKIIGQAPKQEQVRMLLTKALSDMLDSFTVVLKVSAEDLIMVREILAAIQAGGQGGNVIAALVDPLLASGEMLLETERGRIHVGLAQQLARLRGGFHQVSQLRS